MAELATVARPYAEALFRVAKTGNMAVWSDLVSEMAQVGAHPDVRAMASNPNVSDRVIADTLISLLKSELSDEAKNLIEILVENDRVALLPEIGIQFHALKNADQGAADALIYSAFEMSDAQVAELLVVLGKKFGRKLNPTVTIDSTLIGGIRVVVGDEVFDTSIRAKLDQMHATLVS